MSEICQVRGHVAPWAWPVPLPFHYWSIMQILFEPHLRMEMEGEASTSYHHLLVWGKITVQNFAPGQPTAGTTCEYHSVEQQEQLYK